LPLFFLCFGLDLPIGDAEETGVGRVGEEVGDVLAVGVGDEDLTEAIGADKLQDTLHAPAIEAVEDVVEQQDRFAQIDGLRELHGEQIGLLLTLRRHRLEGIALAIGAEEHLEFVFVYTLAGPAEDKVAGAGAAEGLEDIAVLQLAPVDEFHLLASLAGDVGIHLAERGNEMLDEIGSLLIYNRALARHLLLHHLKEVDGELSGGRLFVLLEEGVALLEECVVARQGVEIGAAVLADDAVHKLAASIAAVEDEFVVGRRDHDERDEADMVLQALVVFLAATERLLDPSLEREGELREGGVLLIAAVVGALDHGKRSRVHDVLRVERREGRLGEREVVDGVEQVGLALAVETHEAVDVVGEGEVGLGDVLEVEYVEMSECQVC